MVWISVGLVAAGTLFMTTPPSEVILGGWDPGVYIHTAASIARDGGLQIPAKDISALPAPDQAFLFKDVGGSQQPFQGMFRIAGDRLSPQFMHLYPSLLAMGYALSGVQGALMINPVLNVFALCIMYWFASKVVGRKWALAAVCLLALNPAQVWQAKFSTAEVLTQILLLVGFGTFFTLSGPGSRILPAAISGAALGFAFLTRYDAVLVIVPAVILLTLAPCKSEQKPGVLAFLLVLALVGVHAWIHMNTVAPCYRPLPGLVFPLLQTAAILAIILLVFTQTALGRHLLQRMTRHMWIYRVCFSAALAGFLIFAWYIRPHLIVEGRVLSVITSVLSAVGKPEWLHELGGENALNIQYLTAIFGRFGLLAGFLGVIILGWRLRQRGVAIWLLASVFTLMILITNVFNDHFMMWVSRRFIPVVIPLIVIGIVATAKELHGRFLSISRPLSIGLSSGLLITVILTTVPDTCRMAASSDWPGLCRWYDHLAKTIPARAIVYCDQPGFAAPLRFMYGISSFEYYGDKSIAEFVQQRRQDLCDRNANIYILTTRQQPRLAGIEMRKMEHFTLQSHIQLQPRYSIPDGVKKRGGEFSLYHVTFPEAETNSITATPIVAGTSPTMSNCLLPK
jgi:hypothetical protein